MVFARGEAVQADSPAVVPFVPLEKHLALPRRCATRRSSVEPTLWPRQLPPPTSEHRPWPLQARRLCEQRLVMRTYRSDVSHLPPCRALPWPRQGVHMMHRGTSIVVSEVLSNYFIT